MLKIESSRLSKLSPRYSFLTPQSVPSSILVPSSNADNRALSLVKAEPALHLPAALTPPSVPSSISVPSSNADNRVLSPVKAHPALHLPHTSIRAILDLSAILKC
eukprot:TRINITY_DN12567_c0_g2_i2.p1 TRINITY_DN12567_c0_g2~~TRINITY_DN12567_c0_g2_i2.p1  ORF type:complete len:105 (-),score=8.20 TRINITY_DN12567_c0_g2_i2:4-318(-)